MTCIIGLSRRDELIIGGDSAAINPADYGLMIRDDTKVFEKGDFLIGFTSSFRMGQILRYSWSPPKPKKKQSDTEYIYTDVIESIRTSLKEKGFTTVEKGVETGGTFIIGYKNKVYLVDDDFQVGLSKEGRVTCGCGGEVALGAAGMLINQDVDNEFIVRTSLAMATKYNGGVHHPYVILKKRVY